MYFFIELVSFYNIAIAVVKKNMLACCITVILFFTTYLWKKHGNTQNISAHCINGSTSDACLRKYFGGTMVKS